MTKLSPLEIKNFLNDVINHAEISEPSLAKRLKEFKNWIAKKKDDLLMSKTQVLDLLTEIILDSELWINLSELSLEEKQKLYEEEEIPLAEQIWIEVLFPRWFKEYDPKSQIWKKKLMAGETPQNDESLINNLQDYIDYFGGSTLWRYILDFSMATDILVVGKTRQDICVQLTTSLGSYLDKKEAKWKVTLKDWNIARALIISYNPVTLEYKSLAKSILQQSDSLPSSCYNRLEI